MKKRILGILLSVFMVLGMMPSLGMVAYADDVSYPLYVGGTQVTSANASDVLKDGKVSYDVQTNTLTLNGYTYSGNLGYDPEEQNPGAIKYTGSGTLSIVLNGNNSVSNTATFGSYGIYSSAGLSISGDGELSVSGPEGIYAKGIAISSGTVTATATSNMGNDAYAIKSEGSFSVTDGTVTASGPNGIYAKGITISSGTVEVTATKTGDYDYAIQSVESSFSITGGTVTANGGISALYDSSITGGTVTASGGKYGVWINRGNLTIGKDVTNVTFSGSEAAISGQSGLGKTINAIAGTGWTDTAGTTGQADIAVSTDGQTLSYKKVQFPKASEKFVITSSNFSDYFDSDGLLKETVAEGSVLDFQGEFSGEQYKLTINKKVKVTSTSDPVAKFDSSSTENVSNVMTFTVAAGADYTTISNLEFLNCRLIIQGATHVTVDNINISVKDKSVGSGTGFITIHGGDSDAAASYAVIKNSHIECSNNNRYPCVIISYGGDHATFENNTAKFSGSVGNLFMATTDAYTLKGKTNPEYITYKSNNIENDSSSSINVITLLGEGNIVEGNTIKSKSTAITSGWGASSSNTYKNNNVTNGGSITIYESSTAEGNTTDGSVTVNKGAVFTGNTVGGKLTVSGQDTQIKENSLNSNVSITASNTTFEKNDVKGTVTASSSSKGNTIKQNKVVSTGDYAVILQSTATDSNTSVEDNTLVSKDKLGDDAVNPGTGSGNTIQNNNFNGYTALQDAWIQSIADQTYTGEALEPEVVVKNGDTTLTPGTDYQVTYKDNTNAGTATVTVTRADGSTYGGKAERTFTIAKAAAPDAGTITDAQKPTAKTGDDVVYTGSSIELVNAPSELPAGYTSVLYSLDGENWSDQIPTGTNAGDYTVKVKYTSSNYNDLVGADVPVTINKANAVAATVTANNRTYDGTEKPLVTVDDSTLVGGEMQYALGTETETTGTYGTAIPTATNAGTYYVWYKAVGDDNHNNTAAVCVTASIAKADLTNVSVSQSGTLTYTGEAQTATVNAAATAVNNQAVTFTYSSTESGTYSATIPAFTNAGSYTVYYKASAANHNDATGGFTVTISVVDKTALTAAITEATTYYNSIKSGYSSIAAALKTAIDSAKNVASDDNATAAQVSTALTTLNTSLEKAKSDKAATDEAAQKAAEEKEYKEYSESKKSEADALAKAGDSSECSKLISDAKAAIDALAADTTKSLAQKKAAADEIIKKLESDLQAQREAEEKSKVIEGSTVEVNGSSVMVTSVADATVTFTVAANEIKVTVPDTVTLADGRDYEVTAVAAGSFKGSKIRTVVIGANVEKLASKAFSGSKATKLVVNSKKLTKSRVKNSLKGSKIKTVKVKVGTKKQNKKYVKKYKKIFTKKNCGRKVTVKK